MRHRPHREGRLDLSNVRMLVLDEADEMLRKGFAAMGTIVERPDRQTVLFSASSWRTKTNQDSLCLVVTV